LNFESALEYVRYFGFQVQDVLNVDATKTVSSFSNAISEVILQIAANNSLLKTLASVYPEWTSYNSNDNYLISLLNNYNTIARQCGLPSTTLTNLPNASVSRFNVIVSTNLQNQLNFVINQIIVASGSNLAFRLSLNGYYPLNTLQLSNASKFLLSTDNVFDVINLVQDSESLIAKPNSITNKQLYLFNKVIAVGKSNIVVTPIDSLTPVKFDFVSLLNSTSPATSLLLGDGSSVSNTPPNTLRNTPRVLLETVIAYGYSAKEAVLVQNTNLGDYDTPGLIGNLTEDPTAVFELDAILFPDPSLRILRSINDVVLANSNDYVNISKAVSNIIGDGNVSISTILSYADSDTVYNETIVNALGGDVNSAIASYLLSFSNPAKFFNVLNNNTIPPAVFEALPNVANNYNNSNLGAYLFNAALSNLSNIRNITEIVNIIFDANVTIVDTKVNFDASNAALVSIISAFFTEISSGIQSCQNDVQSQIIIKKLMYFYNNLNNSVITAVYATHTPLGLWAKYVNVKFLCYADADQKTISNYDIDELLNVSQQVTFYDFSSGKASGIVNVQLITAEELINEGIIDVSQVPIYISFADSSSGSIQTSQTANLQLIVTVAKAMDQASNSQSYTHNIYSLLENNEVLFNAIIGGTYDAPSLAQSASLPVPTIEFIINRVLANYNADGSIKINDNPYNNPYNPYSEDN